MTTTTRTRKTTAAPKTTPRTPAAKVNKTPAKTATKPAAKVAPAATRTPSSSTVELNERILNHLRTNGPAGSYGVAKALGLTGSTAYSRLLRMLAAGLVTLDSEKPVRYAAPTARKATPRKRTAAAKK